MAMSYVYILHFHQKLAHARHYIGCTGDLKQRITAHANGAGARLMEVINQEGITWELGGLYSCSHAEMRRHEKSFKRMHNSHRFCQLCHPKDQLRVATLQQENIHNVKFPRQSVALQNGHIDINTVRELEPEEESTGMEFILSLMRKDKDALGFVPVGGAKGISQLLHKRQIVIAYENVEPCGYAFYTINVANTNVNIHQVCVADGHRHKGHGADLVRYIVEKHDGQEVVAKVRDDLAANHFWEAMGFNVVHTKIHETSGSTIHHYSTQEKQS